LWNELWELLTPTAGAHLSGVALYAGLAVLGLAVGILTGVFGIGGGFVIVPLLHLLFGIHYNIAVGSSLSFTIGTGATGMARHMRLRNVEMRTTLVMAMGSVCGAVLGAMILTHLKESLGAGESQDFNRLMDGLFIVLLLLTAWIVFRSPGHAATSKSLLQRLPAPPYIDLPAADREKISLPGLLLVGIAVGICKGLLGIGGGVLFMPLLLVVVGLTTHQAVGTSLGVVFFSSIAGTLEHGREGNVNLVLAMVLLAGSTVGVQIGVWVCQRLQGRRLRRYFALLALVVALALGWSLAADLLG